MVPARKPVPVTPVLPARRSPAPAGARRPRAGETLKVWLIGAACFLLGLVVIGQYSGIVFLHFEISRAESRLLELEGEYRRLELEAARLASLSRIETVARQELGMREPSQSQVRVLTAHQGE